MTTLKLKSGLTLSTGLIEKMIEDTVSGDMEWVYQGGMYIFNSDEFNVAFAERDALFSNAKKIAITVGATNNGQDIADYYKQDNEWGIVNKLKDAIIASVSKSAA